MSAARGCTNDDCAMKHKKKKFKPDDLFCPKCGTKLVYVCADCHDPVEKMNNKYCGTCQESRDAKKVARKDAAIKVAEKVVPVALPVIAKDPKMAVKAVGAAGGKAVKTVVKIVKR